MPANSDRRIHGGYDGPVVTIYVGKDADQVKYKLSKNLVCYYSDFFDKAFNGDFIEGQEQVLYLTEEKKQTFELFIHWAYTGKLVLSVLPKPVQGTDGAQSSDVTVETIDICLDLLLFADKMLLASEGPATTVEIYLRSLLMEKRNGLLPRHVKLALTLRSGHPVRHLFANAITQEFMKANWYTASKPKAESMFEITFAQNKDFALDMLISVTKTLKTRRMSKKDFILIDPLDCKEFTL